MFVFSFFAVKGQQTFLSPVSYWVFTPYIYNPAMVGSKDFLSIGVNAAFLGKSNTQLISGNTRITKTNSGYFSSPDITEFKNIGVGASVFKNFDGLLRNIGLSASGSYQIPLNTRELSFLSFGVSVKEEYNTITTELGNLPKKTFNPNLDLGIFYYGTNFFTGLSKINILGRPWKPESLGISKVPVSGEYFFTAGYKILLSKSLSIVLEPSVLLTTDFTFDKKSNNINPIIKLYLDNFCIGTSFDSDGKISIFEQFRHPRFYFGAFYEMASKTPYYKNMPTIEVTVGINIQSDKTRITNHSYW
jgi:type IX secretion system PorP/SprF family membrane protein